jgi:hypothetical protein
LLSIIELCVAGQGGLEVRGHGAGQALPLDLHDGGGGRHGRHHPPGPQLVRRQEAHRQGALGHWHRRRRTKGPQGRDAATRHVLVMAGQATCYFMADWATCWPWRAGSPAGHSGQGYRLAIAGWATCWPWRAGPPAGHGGPGHLLAVTSWVNC